MKTVILKNDTGDYKIVLQGSPKELSAIGRALISLSLNPADERKFVSKQPGKGDIHFTFRS